MQHSDDALDCGILYIEPEVIDNDVLDLQGVCLFNPNPMPIVGNTSIIEVDRIKMCHPSKSSSHISQ